MFDGTTTILVVDDNDAERYFVSRVLRKAGYEVRESATGVDALRLAREAPNLITLDVRLPDLNGFEVCRRLKADPATRDIPVLHVSASFTGSDSKAEGLEGGADGYLTHPVDPAELIATVRSLLRAQRAEARVRAAAREWTTTFDAISDAVCLTAERGEIMRCNKAFARLLGQPFTALIGRPLAELIPELAPLADLGGNEAVEVRIGDRHYRVSPSPSPGPGSSAGRAWVLGDITERRRAEESLRESEERARVRLQEIEAVYNSAPTGLCVIDSSFRYVRVNQRLAEMNGLPVSAHLGRTVREVLPHLADEVEPMLRSVLETGQPIIGLEIRGETMAQPGRERVWIETWYPLTAPDGRVIGINISAEEVTEQRRAQEHLEQAQRLEAVGRLAGGVAHETNNQMTVVLGCANFVLRHPALPDAARADIEQIRQAAERTAGITAQLLAFGRRQVVRPEVLDLNQVITRLQPFLERTLGEGAMLALRLAPDLPRVKADVGQLEQVLLNLTLNARDAMPLGGALTIRSSPIQIGRDGNEHYAGVELAPGLYASIEISDTGHGMDDETLRRAFEPFFTTKGVGKGTGLGLSMVYGIIRQSGGYITAASAPGRGATFRFCLPAAAEGAPEARLGEAHRTRASGGRTVLLVEDDPSVRAVLVRELTDSDYRVLQAENGRQALEVVRRHRGDLDVVITDLRMPEMDGRELADELARLWPDLPVVFMSGHPDVEAVGQSSTGGPRLVHKPFTGAELSRLLDEVLARS